MNGALVLAYLGGLVDGDGYFKITANYRTPGIRHPYYATVAGLAQMWPGPAVRLFAETFGGSAKEVPTARGTAMTRCELRGAAAEGAAHRLLPFLLIKREQAMLFLEASRVRPKRHGRTPPWEGGHEQVRRIKDALASIQQGLWNQSSMRLPLSEPWAGLDRLAPKQLGWTRAETCAYLAGIMDSDGNFRIYRQHARGMRWLHYRLNIRCAQVEPSPAVELLASTFGGRVAVKKSKRPDLRNLATWDLHDKAAVPAIEALLPYLRVKWTDACLLLELRDLKSRKKDDLTVWEHRTRWPHNSTMRKRSYSAAQVEQFERVRKALLALHASKPAFAASVPEVRG